MNKTRNWIAGLALVSLLAIGTIAVAGSGFGASRVFEAQQATIGGCGLYERDADGDGIPNSEDPDWVRPMNGSGYGERQGHRQTLSATRPMDGTGFGVRQGSGAGQGIGGGIHDGSCL